MIVVSANGTELVQLDARSPTPRPGEVLLCSTVRNERDRLPYFMEYYRQLGVDRFLFVDNDSSDGTTDLLLEQPDAHVFHTQGSYVVSRHGVHWLNALADRLAAGHWVVVVDADELLVYPGCEWRPLGPLTQLLDADGNTALLAFLVDMYGDRPIRDTAYVPGTPFLDTCPYFDADSYEYWRFRSRARAAWRMRGMRRWWQLSGRVPARGGARRRLFWGHAPPGVGPPYLPKVPLVRWSQGVALASSTHAVRGVTLAPTTGALLHFKLFSDFVARAPAEAERGEHWQGAAQYSVYARALSARPDLHPMYAGSTRYEGSTQLLDLGLIFST